MRPCRFANRLYGPITALVCATAVARCSGTGPDSFTTRHSSSPTEDGRKPSDDSEGIPGYLTSSDVQYQTDASGTTTHAHGAAGAVTASPGHHTEDLAVAFWKVPHAGAPTVAATQSSTPTLIGTANVQADGSFDFDLPRLGSDQDLVLSVVLRASPPATKPEGGALVAPERYSPAGTADATAAGALAGINGGGNTSTAPTTHTDTANATNSDSSGDAGALLNDDERNAYRQCRLSSEGMLRFITAPLRVLEVTAEDVRNGTIVDLATGPSVVFVRIGADKVDGAVLSLLNPQSLYCVPAPVSRGLLVVQRACGAALVTPADVRGATAIKELPCTP